MIRLSQAAKQLNIELPMLIEILKEFDIHVDDEPNDKITLEQYKVMEAEFGSGEKNFSLVPLKHEDSLWLSMLKHKINAIRLADRKQKGLIYTKEEYNHFAQGQPVHLEIDFEFPDHFTDEEIKSIITESLLKLDNMHRDMGGKGLKVRNLQVLLQERFQEVMQ